MLDRCYNPRSKDFKYYGLKGVVVCKKWRENPQSFYLWCRNTFKVGCTLDRIDNDGPYSPSNCRWATAKEQQKNTSWAKDGSRKLFLSKLSKEANKSRKICFDAVFGDPRTRLGKVCPSCVMYKENSEYYNNKHTADNKCLYCKICLNARNKEYKNRVRK